MLNAKVRVHRTNLISTMIKDEIYSIIFYINVLQSEFFEAYKECKKKEHTRGIEERRKSYE